MCRCRTGKVTDTTRIDRLAPTVHELVKKKARVVLLSHFGRPKGHRDPQRLSGAQIVLDRRQATGA